MLNQNPSVVARSQFSRLEAALLWTLAGFTGIALIGYGVFARHPENLAGLPEIYLQFYGKAYPLFAQTHVWLTGVVLLVFLTGRVRHRWISAFVAVYALSFLSEFIGTGYGIPFGPYQYTSMLGGKWFGRVPYLIPLSWFTMAIPAYALSMAAFPDSRSRIRQILFGAFLLAAWDLSLDPAMSYLTLYWQWGEAGMFYGMPLVNLAGWYITGIVLMVTLRGLGAHQWLSTLSRQWLSRYYLLVMLMPFGMVLLAGLWWSVLATLVAVGAGLFVVSNRVGSLPPEADDESAETLNTWKYFSDHSKSFSFAALFFNRTERELVSGVYAFCRITDDHVDAAPKDLAENTETRLNEWQRRTRLAYDNKASGIAWLDDVMDATRKSGAPISLIDDLFHGVRSDLGTVSVESVEELDRYSYQVASVVGIWMSYLFGVTSPEAHRRAASLGRAMQYSNVLRDVGEDLGNDRIYLPADLLRKHGVTSEDLHQMKRTGHITPSYRDLIGDVMDIADASYEEAWAGIAELPGSFGHAVAVAADVYRGIHGAILANDYDNLKRRAHTSLLTKVRLAIGALFRLSRMKRNTATKNPLTARGNERHAIR